MKLIGIFLLCAAAVSVRGRPFTKEEALAMANDCKVQTGATDDDVAVFFRYEPAGSTEAKCMRACHMKKLKILSDEGKMVREGTLVALGADNEQVGIDIVETCMAIEVPADHCEAAEAYSLCLTNTSRAKGLVFES